MKLHFTPRKLASTALALGVATAAVVGGSTALWTASTTNPGNSVTAGTFVLTNDKDTAPVFTAVSGAKPGDSGGDTVTVTNGGNTAMKLRLTQGAVVSGATLGAELKLTIHDGTNCIYPAGPGACPDTSAGLGGAWNGTAALNGAADIATLAAGDSKTYTVNWGFPSTVGGTTGQGETASFGLTFTGNQA